MLTIDHKIKTELAEKSLLQVSSEY